MSLLAANRLAAIPAMPVPIIISSHLMSPPVLCIVSIRFQFQSEKSAVHGFQQFGLCQGGIPEQWLLAPPAFA